MSSENHDIVFMFSKSYANIALLFTFLCSILAMITGYKYHNKFTELKFFYLYPLSSFLQITLCTLGILLKANTKVIDELTAVSTNIFLLIEFLLIYNFFRQVLKSKIAKQILQIVTLLYIVTLFLYWTWGNSFFIFPVHMFILEAFCVLTPGFFYFSELIKYPTTNSMLREPSFWISTGIIFYYACTLPIFLSKDFMYDENGIINEKNLYTINFICYGILFLLITKAYLCPKRDTP